MTLMQLIKLVLDDAYAGIQGKTNEDKDYLIKNELKMLSKEYENLTNVTRTPIDYSDPLKRFAYIYKYTVAHADYIRQLIRSEQTLCDLFKQPSVEVACLGGGPGSDLLGILKYLITAKVSGNSLTCYIFDKERAWGDSWSDVAQALNAPFKLFPIFQQMDVTDIKTWASYNKFLRADLFTLSYFASEVWTIKDQAEPFFEHCLAHMKAGAMLLFVDNHSPKFDDWQWFDQIANRNKLKVIKSAKEKLVFSIDEEKTDLGIYFTKFGWPKRESNATYRILRKE